MPRKRKGSGDGHEVVPSKKPKRPPPRNRASPNSLLAACKDLSDGKKNAIDEMELKAFKRSSATTSSVFLVNGLLGYTSQTPVKWLFWGVGGSLLTKSRFIV